MIFALAAALALAHVDLPPAPNEVREANQSWRTCISDGLDRRADLTRGGGDVHGLASAILAECRPQQDAALDARARWVEGLELSPAQKTAVLQRSQRDVRNMHNSIIFRARRSAHASDQDWE